MPVFVQHSFFIYGFWNVPTLRSQRFGTMHSRTTKKRLDMIRRTRRGDVITTRYARSTKPWFHFPVGTPMERITVATAPVVSADEQLRLRLLRPDSVRREG